MNVVGLKNAAEIGLVRRAGAKALDGRLLVAEGFKEGIRKVVRIKRLIRQLSKWPLQFQQRSTSVLSQKFAYKNGRFSVG